jgi:PAS domain S-box-containing protein
LPDLIIAGGSTALNFLIDFRTSLFTQIPIVHLGTSRLESDGNSPDPMIGGIPIDGESTDSLEIALKLQPDIREIAVVAGSADFDQRSLAVVRSAVHDFKPEIKFTWLTDLTLEEIRDAVSKLPDHCAVLYLTMFEDAAGRTYTPREALEFFAPASSVPIYGRYDTYLGHGLVGGSMVTFEETGRKAARVGIRVFEGSSALEAAQSERHEPVAMFDGKQLQRWKIDESHLPQGSVVLFRRHSVWEDHRKEILVAVALCILEAILIGLLIFQLQRRKRAEISLREGEQRMNLAVESANFGIWVRDIVNGDVWATAKWRELFGFAPDETLTLEGVLARIHPDDRKSTIESFDSAQEHRAGYDLEFRVVIPGKSTRWIASKGSFESDASGQIRRSMGVSRDFTERKVAEDTARDLGGRLIHAQEEAQRRLARELHDDLSQSLALLSVELEMYGQNPSPSLAETTTRMEGFSKRAKGVSSELHRLSHSLHPAKLDQLGLETALRGFCREFAQAHQMAISFVAQGIPKPLPDDMALCLYRVAQESLHNVVKHSGATEAAVSLGLEESELVLIVTDNGSGFDPSSDHSSGSLGVVGMGERARFVGGCMNITSTSQGGTQVEIRLPIESKL